VPFKTLIGVVSPDIVILEPVPKGGNGTVGTPDAGLATAEVNKHNFDAFVPNVILPLDIDIVDTVNV